MSNLNLPDPQRFLTPADSLGVVLIEPQIPQNTGNITRLCACTGANLLLVGQLGFRLNDKFLDRAAMDYRAAAEPVHVPTYEAVQAKYPGHQAFYLSSKASRPYWEVDFPEECLLVFGSETTGLPEAFLEGQAEAGQAIRIPMIEGARSHNLSNSVALVLYEVLRQRQVKKA
jgi:tRNA (cytidine/uridine-2'-O-)-methyltransferase